MIGKLTGIVDHVADDHAILDVAGVGYLVHCPSSTLSRLQAGATVSLMIETRITDETIKLYGFFTAEEREWFRLLQTVQNVGARVALNVLSALSPRELERALALGDKARDRPRARRGAETRAAHRHRTERQGAVDDAARQAARRCRRSSPARAGPKPMRSLALVKLGYSQGQAAEAVARAARDLGDHAGADVLIRESLRAMGR